LTVDYLHYFAYGSNLTASRLIARVGALEDLGRATLTGYRLRFSKNGRDGSSKCDLVNTGETGDVAEGVVYRLPQKAKPLLDRFEGVGKGYRVANVDVSPSTTSTHKSDLKNNKLVSCFVYLAVPPFAEDSLLPYGWYHDFVLEGGRAHEFSSAWLAWVRDHPHQSDADVERCRRNLEILNANVEQALAMFASGEAT